MSDNPARYSDVVGWWRGPSEIHGTRNGTTQSYCGTSAIGWRSAVLALPCVRFLAEANRA
jgi:hypothetical protein